MKIKYTLSIYRILIDSLLLFQELLKSDVYNAEHKTTRQTRLKMPNSPD